MVDVCCGKRVSFSSVDEGGGEVGMERLAEVEGNGVRSIPVLPSPKSSEHRLKVISLVSRL